MPSKHRPGFLDLPDEVQDPRRARVHVLPIPYEETVSYETGTARGPAAIIRASREVELYDEYFDAEPPLSYGVHTLPALKQGCGTGEEMTETVARAVEPILRSGKFPLILGGEHTISAGIVRGVRRVVPEALTVVQIDAHADLRDSFRGIRFSHACAMRRILDENPGPTVQIGIRSWSQEEALFMRANPGRVNILAAERIAQTSLEDFQRQLKDLINGKKVYLTIDVDGMDPSIVPATGTPEPGGLSWWQTRDILRTIAQASTVVAADCVELAPRAGLHMSEYSVARLLMELLNQIMEKK